MAAKWMRGKACINGHEYLQGSYVVTARGRRCLVCFKARFNRQNAKASTKERAAKWRNDNKERLREAHKRWREENATTYKERLRAQRAVPANKVLAMERHKKWRNTEKGRARVRDYKRRWDSSDSGKAHNTYRNFSRRSRDGGLTDFDKEYIRVLRQDPCCYCGAPMRDIDHIKPISRGGDNHWWNLTSACKACNQEKASRTVIQFLLLRRKTVDVESI